MCGGFFARRAEAPRHHCGEGLVLRLSAAVGSVVWLKLSSAVGHGRYWTSMRFACGSIADVMCWTALWFAALDARLWFDLGTRGFVDGGSLRFNLLMVVRLMVVC